MNIDEQIDSIIAKSINIIQSEIEKIEEQQETEEGLDKETSNKLIELLKTLVIVQRDKRIGAKESVIETTTMSNQELEAAILIEAEKIKNNK